MGRTAGHVQFFTGKRIKGRASALADAILYKVDERIGFFENLSEIYLAWSVYGLSAQAGINSGSVIELYALAKRDPQALTDIITCIKNESEKSKRGETNKHPIQKLGPGSHIST